MAESNYGYTGDLESAAPFRNWTDAELRIHATELGINAAARMNREQLVEAIRDRAVRATITD